MTTKKTTTKRRGRPRKVKETRTLTVEESLGILNPFFEARETEMLDFRSHRTHLLPEKNMFTFTLDMLSLNVVIGLMEHKQVKNVYFLPISHPLGLPGPTQFCRYRVIIEYHMIEE